MKRTILLFILIFTALMKIEAQYFTPVYVSMDKYKTLDSAYLKCIYKLTYVKDSLNPKKTTRIDMQTLLVGPKITKYFSQYLVDYNLKCSELLKKGAKSIPSYFEQGTSGYEVFKNYPSDKFTVTELGSQTRENYLYEEAVPDLQWEMAQGIDTILSYPCQKGTSTFRGRTYEAWFTPEIPISNGPWKFGGLPGLILKVSDLQHNYIFECIGISTLKKKESINLYQVNYTPIDRKDLNKINYRMHANYGAFSKSMGVELHMMSNGKEIDSKDIKLPYNPIELN
jgi:GLPGLI family protein